MGPRSYGLIEPSLKAVLSMNPSVFSVVILAAFSYYHVLVMSGFTAQITSVAWDSQYAR